LFFCAKSFTLKASQAGGTGQLLGGSVAGPVLKKSQFVSNCPLFRTALLLSLNCPVERKRNLILSFQEKEWGQ
jgi:hypothetical protein